MMCRTHRGFTLIQRLIVVAIIGVLAAIAVPNFLQAQTRAKVARAIGDLKSLGNALEMYHTDMNQYPISQSGPRSLNALTTPVAYMGSVPSNPFRNTPLIDQTTNFVNNRTGTPVKQFSYEYTANDMFYHNQYRETGLTPLESIRRAPHGYILSAYPKDFNSTVHNYWIFMYGAIPGDQTSAGAASAGFGQAGSWESMMYSSENPNGAIVRTNTGAWPK